MKKSQWLRKPHRIKKKRSIFGSRFFWLGLLFFVFIALVFYSLFFSEFFQVKRIIISGEKEINREDIQSTVNQKLEKRIFFFPSKSIFLISPRAIREELLENFPGIAEVEIKKGFPDSLEIIVLERFSLATWCKEFHCFLIDKEGVIFKETQSQEVYPKIRDKRETGLSVLGTRVIDKNYLSKILEIDKKIKDLLKIDIDEFTIIDEFLTVKTIEDWEIYFKPTGDLDWQLTELRLILEKQIPSEKRRDLEYIDLRFSRIYYKYRR